MRRSTAFFAVIPAFLAAPAAAHIGAGEALAFSARLLHPLRGRSRARSTGLGLVLVLVQ
jgi:hypothetical protein